MFGLRASAIIAVCWYATRLIPGAPNVMNYLIQIIIIEYVWYDNCGGVTKYGHNRFFS